MKISAEVVPHVAGSWKGFLATAVYVNDVLLSKNSPLRLVAGGLTPEEAVEWLKHVFETTGSTLVEFEVENPKLHTLEY